MKKAITKVPVPMAKTPQAANALYRADQNLDRGGRAAFVAASSDLDRVGVNELGDSFKVRFGTARRSGP